MEQCYYFNRYELLDVRDLSGMDRRSFEQLNKYGRSITFLNVAFQHHGNKLATQTQMGRVRLRKQT
jgi:hypothetical protein